MGEHSLPVWIQTSLLAKEIACGLCERKETKAVQDKMCKIRWHKSVSVNIIIGIYYRFSVIICITFHVTSHSLFSLLQERDHPMTFINPNTAKLELCLHYLVNLCCPLNTYNEFVHVKDYLLHLLHIWFGCCAPLRLGLASWNDILTACMSHFLSPCVMV